MIDKPTQQEAQQLTHMRAAAKNELRTVEENQAIKAKLNAEVAGYTDKRDLVNQLLGRIQLAQGLSKLTTVVSFVDLACIKEKQLYREFCGNKLVLPDGISAEPPTVGTWEGFCKALGLSRQKVDEDIQNLSVFGDEALAAMKRVGLGYRDLRKLRKLPQGDRSIVVGEIEANLGDREAIASLIDEIAAKHAQEKQALEKQTTDLTADLEAARKQNTEKNGKIDELNIQLHRRDQMQPDERAKELLKDLYFGFISVTGALLVPEAAIKKILEWEGAPQHLINACYHTVAQIRSALFDLQKKYWLTDVSDDLHSDTWMEDAKRSFAAECREAGASEVLPKVEK